MVLSSKTTAKIEVLLVKKIKGADLHHNGDSVTLLLQNYFGKMKKVAKQENHPSLRSCKEAKPKYF